MNILEFWTVVGALTAVASGLAYDAASHDSGDGRERGQRRATRLGLIGLGIFLTCGSLLALARDLVS